MNFELSDHHKSIRQLARDFAQGELRPRAAQIDEKGDFIRDLIPKMAQLGFMGLTVPEKYEGAGLDLMSASLVIEEVARECGSTALTLVAHNGLGMKHILRFGTEAQRQRYIPDLASGRKISAWALTEPGSGSDASGLKTRAEVTQDGFVLNGSKAFITHGSVGDTYIVLAATDPAKKQKGISAFVIEKGTPGFKPLKPEDKLGCRGSDTSQIALDQVKLGRESLVGELHQGFIDTLKILDQGRVIIASMALGLGEAALRESIRYAKEREQFGKPIADFQAIQWKIANMATELSAARLMIMKAASMHDRGVSAIQESSMAKLFASEAASRACTEAIQIHGGYGYIREYPVERYWRDNRITEIGEGTSEVQRMIIAREILKKTT